MSLKEYWLSKLEIMTVSDSHDMYMYYIKVISTVHVTFLFNHVGITLGFDMTTYTFSEDIGNTSDNIRIVNQSNVLSEIDIPLQLTINMATSTAEEGEPKPLACIIMVLYSNCKIHISRFVVWLRSLSGCYL